MRKKDGESRASGEEVEELEGGFRSGEMCFILVSIHPTRYWVGFLSSRP